MRRSRYERMSHKFYWLDKREESGDVIGDGRNIAHWPFQEAIEVRRWCEKYRNEWIIVDEYNKKYTGADILALMSEYEQ